jgi:hypothetical protein
VFTDAKRDIHADSNCIAYSHRNCNSHFDCHGDFHSHFHPNYNSTTNSNIYAYGYSDDYAQANAYAQAACNPEGTSHAAAAPVITGSVISFRAEVTDRGYNLSRPSITFSMPLTTSVKRS